MLQTLAPGIEEEAALGKRSYWSEDTETRAKIERLADLREKYRYQRRLWGWGLLISILTSSFFVHHPTPLTFPVGLIAFGAGVLSAWAFFQCSRAIHMVDKALAPYRVKEKP